MGHLHIVTADLLLLRSRVYSGWSECCSNEAALIQLIDSWGPSPRCGIMLCRNSCRYQKRQWQEHPREYRTEHVWRLTCWYFQSAELYLMAKKVNHNTTVKYSLKEWKMLYSFTRRPWPMCCLRWKCAGWIWGSARFLSLMSVLIP